MKTRFLFHSFLHRLLGRSARKMCHKKLPRRGAALELQTPVSSDIKDLAVVLDLFAGSQNIHHGVVGVCTLSKLHLHFLGHKADGSLFHTGNGVGGILHLLGAVCAVNFDLLALLHYKYLSLFYMDLSGTPCAPGGFVLRFPFTPQCGPCPSRGCFSHGHHPVHSKRFCHPGGSAPAWYP